MCGNKGTSNGMFSHLNGLSHKRNVAPRHLSKEALSRFIVEHSQNNQDLSELIETIQSDAAYPWPAGKNPRGLERGGPGEMEDWAATGGGGGRKRPLRAESEERQARAAGGFGAEASPGVKLPYPDSLERPQTKEEGEEMIEMGKRLFDLVLGSDFTQLDQRKKEELSQEVEKMLGSKP